MNSETYAYQRSHHLASGAVAISHPQATSHLDSTISFTMSTPPPAFIPAPSEKTFSSYTKDQGRTYAKSRSGYNERLYKTIIDTHTSTGGELNTVLDVGCGPGIATFALSPHFTHTIGLDPSEGMINNARALATTSPTPIRFEISTAEDLGWHLDPPVADASVDLITVATAAHWFDMSKFWPRAARVLKPGGTVAIWGTGSFKMNPSMPNAASIQAALDAIEENDLVPFFEPGNFLTRTLYRELLLPWTIPSPVVDFDAGSFIRKEWGTGAEGAGDTEEFFVGGALSFGMDALEMAGGTTSPVQRWRDANKEKVGTEEDVVRRMRRAVESGLRAAGVKEGDEVVKASIQGVLLIVKKKA